MSNSLKQIRLLPEYSGNQTLLTKDIWTQVINASSQIKIIITSLSQNILFRILTAIQVQKNKQFKIRLILNPVIHHSQFDPLDETTSSKELANSVSDFLYNDISNMDKNTLSEYAELFNYYLREGILVTKVALATSEEDQSIIASKTPFQNIIFFTDSINNSVIFSDIISHRDISIDNESAKVSWSWGDPKHLVNKKTEKIDRIWSNKHDGLLIQEVETDIILEIINDVIKQKDKLKLELFDHQKEAIEKWAENSFRGIFKMCTGAGKTIAALAGLKRLEKNLLELGTTLDTAVIVCPTKILVEQWKKEILKFGFEHVPLLAYDSIGKYYQKLGIYLNRKRHEGLRIVITTDVTFSKHPFAHQIKNAEREGTTGCLIADEMHNYASKLSDLKEYGDYFRYRLGLSATPEIEGNEYLTKSILEYFGGIVGEYDLADAISDGVLCQYKYYPKPVFLDFETSQRYYNLLKNISEQHGKIDINLYRERSDLIRKSKVYLPALNDILNEIEFNNEKMRHILTFCPPGREDTTQDLRLIEEVKAIYEKREIFCSSITAETKQNDRPKILEKFDNGFFKVLLAIGCLDEGFDLPSTRRAIMLYSIDRERQFVQRRGRVLRKAKGKDFAIIHDIIILPHNADLDPSEAERLLEKEMRRYRTFAKLSSNSSEASSIVEEAISCAIMKGLKQC